MDKRGVAEGLAWFMAIIVIIIVLAVFVLIATPIAGGGKSNEYQQITDYYAYKQDSSNSELVLHLSPYFSAIRNIYVSEYFLGHSQNGVFNPVTQFVYLDNGKELKNLFFVVLSKTYKFDLAKYKTYDKDNQTSCFGLSFSNRALGVINDNIAEDYVGASDSSCNPMMGGGPFCDLLPSKSGTFFKTKEKEYSSLTGKFSPVFSRFGITINGCKWGKEA